MKLKVIDFRQVQKDVDIGVAINYNTSFHRAEEAPGTTNPSEAPYSFSRWLLLILESREIEHSQLQTVSLSPAQARVIVQAASASIHTKTMSRTFAEDLDDEVRPVFKSLRFPPEGLFLRLDACSAKDGAHTQPGRLSLHSVQDIILRLSTSQRVWSALTHALSDNADEINLYFLPFDGEMHARNEYRVFCMPQTLRITAVSQYRWHERWAFANDEREMQVLAENIFQGVREVHSRVLQDLELPSGTSNGLDQMMWEQGFTFDVCFDDEAKRCSLIELNTFGAQSGCGSCLFQWIKDKKLLYGECSEEVEFRVTI